MRRKHICGVGKPATQQLLAALPCARCQASNACPCLSPHRGRQDCELVYVAFDILHNGSSALNMEPLERRLSLLRDFVKSGESGERAAGKAWRRAQKQGLHAWSLCGDGPGGEKRPAAAAALSTWAQDRGCHRPASACVCPAVTLPGSCIRGRVEVIVPGQTRFAGRLVSREGRTADDIQQAVEEVRRLSRDWTVAAAEVEG